MNMDSFFDLVYMIGVTQKVGVDVCLSFFWVGGVVRGGHDWESLMLPLRRLQVEDADGGRYLM